MRRAFITALTLSVVLLIAQPGLALASFIENDRPCSIQPSGAAPSSIVKISQPGSEFYNCSSIRNITPMVAPNITIDTPIAGDMLTAETQKIIEWTISGGNGLTFHTWANYSSDNGSTWHQVASIQDYRTNSSGQLSQVWNVSALVSDKCKLRLTVIDSNHQIGTKTTNGTFSIVGALVTIERPKGGEVWKYGTNESIKWNISYGTPPYNCWLNYSNDSGASYTPIPQAQGFVQSQQGVGEYIWHVMANDSLTSRIKVDIVDSQMNCSHSTDASDFAIIGTPPQVESTYPRDGAMHVGTGTIITLNFSQPMNQSSVNGSFTILPSVKGNFSWNGRQVTFTPNSTLQQSTKYKVSIMAGTQNAVGIAMQNEYQFSFTTNGPPRVVVLTPNGGETLTGFSYFNVTWDTIYPARPGNVTLLYSISGINGQRMEIASNISDIEWFQWKVPNTPSMDCWVWVCVNDNITLPNWLNDSSDSAFTITPAPIQLAVTSPNGLENWTSGSVHSITWDVSGGNGSMNFTIEYSINGGVNFTLIAKNYTGMSFQWTVPDLGGPFSDCYVRVTTYDSWTPQQNATDISDTAFTIYSPPSPQVIILSPAGGERWGTNTTKFITWQLHGGVAPVRANLSYSAKGAGGPYIKIVDNIDASTGRYLWRVPNSPSVTCYVKAVIIDSYAKGARRSTATSKLQFTIYRMPPLLLVSFVVPKGGEKWHIGMDYNVSWNHTGGIGPYTTSIKCSTNNGMTYVPVNGTVNKNAISFKWRVFNHPSLACKLKLNVTDSSGQYAIAVSNQFEILNASGMGSVVGYVTFENGSAAGGVLVRLLDNVSINTTSRSDGHFQIDGIPEGGHTVIFSKEGYDDLSIGNITVESDESTSIGTVTMKIAETNNELPLWLLLYALPAVIIAVVFVFVLISVLRSRRQRVEIRRKELAESKPTIFSNMDAPGMMTNTLTPQPVYEAPREISQVQGAVVPPLYINPNEAVNPERTEYASSIEQKPVLIEEVEAPVGVGVPVIEEAEAPNGRAAEKPGEDIVKKALEESRRIKEGRFAQPSTRRPVENEEFDILTLEKLVKLRDKFDSGEISRDEYERTRKQIRGY